MFDDLVKPQVHLGARRWYSLPLSIGAHAIVIGVFLILPLMSLGVLPTPVSAIEWVPPHELLRVVPSLPAPAVRGPAAPPRGGQSNPDAAPVVAPRGISDERGQTGQASFDEGPATSGMTGGVADLGNGSVVEGPPLPPPPPAVREPVPVGGHIRPPQKIRDVAPVYPSLAQNARAEGIVILSATIDTDGRVLSAKILRSAPLFDRAAIDAVLQWQFTPTLLNGVPVPVIMTVTVNFTLQR